MGKYYKNNPFQSKLAKLGLILLVIIIIVCVIFFITKKTNQLVLFQKTEPCYSCLWDGTPNETVRLINSTLYKYKSINNYTESDRLLILGRINKDKNLVCESLIYKKNYLKELDSEEAELVLYEELYFLAKECKDESADYYLDEVLRISQNLGKEWKTIIYSELKQGRVDTEVEKVNIIQKIDIPDNPQKLIIGRTYIEVDSSTIIGSQVDRFNRDWISFYIYLFPLDLPSQNYELKYYDIDYMEGFIIRKLINSTGAKVIPLPNSNVIKTNILVYNWYATDEKGNLRFNVFDDKVQYSTSVCEKNVCLLKDTHGISSLVPEALYHNVSLVIGCGDSEGKMEAAYYLAKKGVDVYFPTDRYVSKVIGHDGKGVLLGSAPINFKQGKAVIGNQSVEININETIIVQDTSHKYYPIMYYDTGTSYFRRLKEISNLPLNLEYVKISNAHQADKIVNKARELDAKVIALKVQYEDEYEAVKKWLLEDESNKAILFHTVAYKPGFKLFNEFPEQTSFGDPKPIFI